MGASGAKYDIATSHFYWIGAVPAMVFVGVFMMPFYYGSRARSVPEYLKLRFDEKTRGFNAISFAAMTIFSSGISLYAMGLLLGVLLGWKRATGHGAFVGLVAGTVAAAIHHGVTLPHIGVAGIKGGWFAITHIYPSEMAQNFWTAIFAWTTCFVVTIVVSLITKARADSELAGLVYSLTERPKEDRLAWYKRPAVLGAIVLVAALVLNVIFW